MLKKINTILLCSLVLIVKIHAECWKIKRILPHADEVSSVEFYKDNEHVITTSVYDVQIFDITDGQCSQLVARNIGWSPRDCGTWVTRAIYNPINSLAAAISGKSILIWNANNPSNLRKIDENAKIKSIAFNQHGTKLLLILEASDEASNVRSNQLLILERGKPIFRKTVNNDMRSATFCPTNDNVWAVISDNKGYVVNRNRRVILNEQHIGPVNSIAFNNDGTLLVTASDDKDVRIFDVSSGHCIQTFEKHKNPVKSAKFSPDGKYVVTASGRVAQVFDIETGNCIATLEGHAYNVVSATFSPNGNYIATASLDGKVIIWEQEPLTRNHANLSRTKQACEEAETKYLTHEPHWVRSARYSKDGEYIITASSDESARIWATNTGKCLMSLRGHTEWVNDALFGPDGKYYATMAGKIARIWDSKAGICICKLEHACQINSISFNHDGTQIATSSNDKTVKIWNIHDGKPLQERIFSESVQSAIYSPDRKHIIIGGENRAYFCDANNINKELYRFTDDFIGTITSISFNHDGSLLAIGSIDKTIQIKVWDVRNKSKLLELSDFEQPIRATVFSYHDDLLAIASGSTIKILDTTTKSCVRVLEGDEGNILSIAFSPKNNDQIVTTSDWSNRARIWDFKKEAVIAESTISQMQHEQTRNNREEALPNLPASTFGASRQMEGASQTAAAAEILSTSLHSTPSGSCQHEESFSGPQPSHNRHHAITSHQSPQHHLSTTPELSSTSPLQMLQQPTIEDRTGKDEGISQATHCLEETLQSTNTLYSSINNETDKFYIVRRNSYMLLDRNYILLDKVTMLHEGYLQKLPNENVVIQLRGLSQNTNTGGGFSAYANARILQQAKNYQEVIKLLKDKALIQQYITELEESLRSRGFTEARISEIKTTDGLPIDDFFGPGIVAHKGIMLGREGIRDHRGAKIDYQLLPSPENIQQLQRPDIAHEISFYSFRNPCSILSLPCICIVNIGTTSKHYIAIRIEEIKKGAYAVIFVDSLQQTQECDKLEESLATFLESLKITNPAEYEAAIRQFNPLSTSHGLVNKIDAYEQYFARWFKAMPQYFGHQTIPTPAHCPTTNATLRTHQPLVPRQERRIGQDGLSYLQAALCLQPQPIRDHHQATTLQSSHHLPSMPAVHCTTPNATLPTDQPLVPRPERRIVLPCLPAAPLCMLPQPIHDHHHTTTTSQSLPHHLSTTAVHRSTPNATLPTCQPSETRQDGRPGQDEVFCPQAAHCPERTLPSTNNLYSSINSETKKIHLNQNSCKLLDKVTNQHVGYLHMFPNENVVIQLSGLSQNTHKGCGFFAYANARILQEAKNYQELVTTLKNEASIQPFITELERSLRIRGFTPDGISKIKTTQGLHIDTFFEHGMVAHNGIMLGNEGMRDYDGAKISYHLFPSAENIQQLQCPEIAHDMNFYSFSNPHAIRSLPCICIVNIGTTDGHYIAIRIEQIKRGAYAIIFVDSVQQTQERDNAAESLATYLEQLRITDPVEYEDAMSQFNPLSPITYGLVDKIDAYQQYFAQWFQAMPQCFGHQTIPDTASICQEEILLSQNTIQNNHRLDILARTLLADKAHIALFSVGSRGYESQEIPAFIKFLATRHPNEMIHIYSISDENGHSSSLSLKAQEECTKYYYEHGHYAQLPENQSFQQVSLPGELIERFKSNLFPNIEVRSVKVYLPGSHKEGVWWDKQFYNDFTNFIEKKVHAGGIVFIGNNGGVCPGTGWAMMKTFAAVAYEAKYLRNLPSENIQIYAVTGTGHQSFGRGSQFYAYDPPGEYQHKYPDPNGQLFVCGELGMDIVCFENQSFQNKGQCPPIDYIVEGTNHALRVTQINGQECPHDSYLKAISVPEYNY